MSVPGREDLRRIAVALDRHRPVAGWEDQGLCQQSDPELWFPERESDDDADGFSQVREARRICRRCPVRLDCLGYSLARNDRFGMWGGLTYGQRKQVRTWLEALTGSRSA